VYDREIIPTCDWLQSNVTNEALVSKEFRVDVGRMLPQYLRKRASSANVSFQIMSRDLQDYEEGEDVKAVPLLIGIAPEKLTSWKHQRVYLGLDEATLIKLFKDADVKAVILESYFRRLLDRETIRSLFEGASVQRLVVFPEAKTNDGKATLTLSERACELFQSKIIPSYTPPRSLEFVQGSEVWEQGIDSTVYDFAVLNDQMVVVTHTVSEISKVDASTGEQQKPEYRVEGYVSWRRADVEFYKDLFIELFEAKIEYEIQVQGSEIKGSRQQELQAQ
jgi:hypothetical protein